MISKKSKDNYYLPLLLSELALKFNKEILNYSDCIELSNVLIESNISVSAHTIGRLYKIIKSNSSPYKATLDLLSKYLGYGNFIKFCARINLNNTFSTPINVSDYQSKILCFTSFNNYLITGEQNGAIKAKSIINQDLTIDLFHHSQSVVNIIANNDLVFYQDCNNEIFFLDLRDKI